MHSLRETTLASATKALDLTTSRVVTPKILPMSDTPFFWNISQQIGTVELTCTHATQK